MNKTIFHKGLYRDQLKQLRLIGFIGLGLLSLAAILIPIGRAISIAQDRQQGFASYVGRTNVNITEAHFYLYFVLVLLVPLLALACFHFLTQRNSSDYYHSLPHTRTCIFTCSIVAIFTWTTILVWIPTLLSVIMYTILGKYFVLEIGLLLRFALFMYVASLFVTASISIACSLTGTVFTNVIVTGIIVFLPRIFIFCLVQMIAGSSSLLIGSHLFPLLDFSYNIIFGLLLMRINQASLTWSGLLYSTILMILYLLVGLLVFKRRRSETANQAAVSRKVQTGIRLLLGTAVSLIPISLIFNYITDRNSLGGSSAIFIYVICILYLVACLVMLLYELLTTKKFRNVIKALPSIGILAIINVVVLLASLGIQKALVNYSPSANEIDYVVFERSVSDRDKEYYDELVNNIKIKDKKVLQLISKTLKDNVDGSIYHDNYIGDTQLDTLIVGIHSGLSTHYRRLTIPIDDMNTITSTSATNEAYINAYQMLPELSGNKLSLYNTALSDKDYLELYNTAREEIKGLNFETWFNQLYSDNYPLDTIVFYATVNNKSVKGTIPITNNLPKTCMKYVELTENANKKEKSQALTIIKDIVANRIDEYTDYYVDITLFDLKSGNYYLFSKAPNDSSDLMGRDILNAISSSTKDSSTLSIENDCIVTISYYFFDDNSTSSTNGTCNFILDKSDISGWKSYVDEIEGSEDFE